MVGPERVSGSTVFGQHDYRGVPGVAVGCPDLGRLGMRKRREAWQQDINARQRNVVFPDTVQNEGRFWRNLASEKQKLTIGQAVGVALIFLTLAGFAWREAVRTFRFGTSGPLFDRLVATLASFGSYAILLGLFGALFLLLRWRVRRALLSGRRPDRPR